MKFYILIIFSILIISSVSAYSNTTFNNSLSIENLTFTGNQNITRYLSVPQNTYLTNARLNLTGFNGTIISGTSSNLTYLSLNSSTLYAEDMYANTTNIMVLQGELNTASNLRIAIFNLNGNYIYNYTVQDVGYSQRAGLSFFLNNSNLYIYSIYNDSLMEYYLNGTYIRRLGTTSPYLQVGTVNADTDNQYVYYHRGTYIFKSYFNGTEISNATLPFSSIDIKTFNNKLYVLESPKTIHEYDNNLNPTGYNFTVYANTDSFKIINYTLYGIDAISQNPFFSKYELYLKNINVSMIINNENAFTYNGLFNQTNNRTNNFASYINSYLSTCTYSSGYCQVPIQFHSDTAGILRYSDMLYTNEGFVENSQTYTGSVLEGSSNQFIINISYDNYTFSPVGILVYNNTNYTSTRLDNNANTIFYVNASAPLITTSQSIPFYWIIAMSNSTSTIYYNSTANSQTVTEINLTTSCTGSAFPFINISNYDEQSLSPISGTVEYIINLENNGEIVTRANGTISGTNGSICTTQNLTNLGNTYSAQLRYYSASHTYETYNIQSNPVTNLPISIPLYFLLNASATQFVINYVDFQYFEHPNAIIQVQRQYLVNDNYNVVEIPIIASDGTSKASFDTNNIRYKLIIIENGEILDIFENLFPACQNLVLGTCEINIRGTEDINTVEAEDFTYTFSNQNNTITLTYIIPSGTPRTVSLNTNQRSRFLDDISTCTNFVFASGGTLSCSYNNTVGDSIVSIQVDIDGVATLFGDIPVSENLNDVFLGNNYFIAFILILTLVLTFASSGIFKLISIGVGVIFLALIFLIKGVSVGTVATSTGWLIVVIVIAIYEINKNEENYS